MNVNKISLLVLGMTKHEQKDVLVYFKDGLHKLIIATSVAEEGLDITKCNLVIRYEHVTNEIVRTQSRGKVPRFSYVYIYVLLRTVHINQRFGATRVTFIPILSLIFHALECFCVKLVSLMFIKCPRNMDYSFTGAHHSEA